MVYRKIWLNLGYITRLGGKKPTGTLKLIFGKRIFFQEEFVGGGGRGNNNNNLKKRKKKNANFQTLILSLTIYIS
jgi:hypothetical protein